MNDPLFGGHALFPLPHWLVFGNNAEDEFRAGLDIIDEELEAVNRRKRWISICQYFTPLILLLFVFWLVFRVVG